MTENLPARRAGHQDRQAVADVLSKAMADGQLSPAEFDERSAQVWSATFRAELEPLVADLVEPGTDVFGGASSLSFPERPGGTRTSIAVMSGVDRTGDWQVAGTHTSLALMGGCNVNLLEAQLSGPRTTINAVAVMGGVDVVVPEDVRVISEGLGLMGGFEVTNHESATVQMSSLPADAPTVVVRGFALMGGVNIIRAARDARI